MRETFKRGLCKEERAHLTWPFYEELGLMIKAAFQLNIKEVFYYLKRTDRRLKILSSILEAERLGLYEAAEHQTSILLREILYEAEQRNNK